MKTQTFTTLPLPELIGKTLEEVKAYLEEKYPGRLAKEEHREAFIKQCTDTEGWNWYYFFGSLVRGDYGSWDVPCAYRYGSSFVRGADWLGLVWVSDRRVVLLGDSEVEALKPGALNLDSLDIDIAIARVKKEGYKVIKEI